MEGHAPRGSAEGFAYEDGGAKTFSMDEFARSPRSNIG
jgi:hypothetical protein